MFASGTLREYRQRYPHVNIGAIKNWARQILRGLAYLHGHDPPVIHRDIKCDNILINGHLGQVKISDFGLAAVLRGSQPAHTVIGTPEFMAPELYEEEYNELVDIYSFGMCVLEMLTWEYPYSECFNPAQIYKKVTSGRLPDAFYGIHDPEAKRFVGRCLEDVSKRPSAEELLLDPFLALDDHTVPADAVDGIRSQDQDGLHSMEFHDANSTVWRTDMTITGKMNPEDDTIFLRVQIADEEGHVRNIHFPFDIVCDTPIDVANEMVKELEITDREPSEIAEMIAQEITALVPGWKARSAPNYVYHVYNYEDDAEDGCNHPFYSLSSSASSQGSVFGTGHCLGMLDQQQHPHREEWFQGDLHSDEDAMSYTESGRYSSVNYSSRDEQESKVIFHGSHKSTKLGEDAAVADEFYKQCNILPERSRKPVGGRRLTRNRSMVDMRNQLLHRNLAEQLKKRLFKTVGAVENIGFQTPCDGSRNPSSLVMDPEAGQSPNALKKNSWKATLLLAYQSLGVVYGDLSISPLYVYKSTFAADIKHSESNEEIFGVLSFVFWTLTLVPLFKYVFIVLRADDNGQGGTFALYSLICRNVNVSLLPNRQAADEELSTYRYESHPESSYKPRIKTWIEKHKNLHVVLLIVVMLGTCMVIGDGVLTPAISVFSAVSGLELSLSKAHHEYAVVPITCFLIVCLFALQHYGTHRVGFLFAPIIITWLLCISGLGIYNIVKWNPLIYQALSPYYMLKFLKKTRKAGWMSLGGILLCMTGSEAMFADLGHFSYRAIQIAFTSCIYPALVLAYMGQAAYLSKHHIISNSYQIGFYVYVPESVRWPVLVIAILASIVGSQAIISGTFSIVSQSQSLGCFPRVKVVHTSNKVHGQIYIPEVNWALMILCVAVALGFRDTKHMGNASGLAVITVMLVTTCLTSLVMILCWHNSPLLALAFFLVFGSIEALFFSSSLMKFLDGAWLPILLALILMAIMFVWHYATIKKYEFDLQNKLSLDWLLALGNSLGISRVPGIGLVYTDLISGVPANFSHFVTNLPAFHQILVFVCIKYVPVPFVPASERYLVSRVGPPEFRSYRCIVRYGYRDVHQDVNSFESELITSLADFIYSEALQHCDPSNAEAEGGLTVIGSSPYNSSTKLNLRDANMTVQISDEGNSEGKEAMGKVKRVRFLVEESESSTDGVVIDEELQELLAAQESGTAFILGHSHIRSKPGSSMIKKVAIDLVYNFLRRNCRGPDVALRLPPESLLEVGMVYLL
ncbi:unnamed protein product [Musa textilis]